MKQNKKFNTITKEGLDNFLRLNRSYTGKEIITAYTLAWFNVANSEIPKDLPKKHLEEMEKILTNSYKRDD